MAKRTFSKKLLPLALLLLMGGVYANGENSKVKQIIKSINDDIPQDGGTLPEVVITGSQGGGGSSGGVDVSGVTITTPPTVPSSNQPAGGGGGGSSNSSSGSSGSTGTATIATVDDYVGEAELDLIDLLPVKTRHKIDTLLSKPVLSILEIKKLRGLIGGIPKELDRKTYFKQLQYKVPYYNQRDNVSLQDETGSVIPIGKPAADVMCNLTSQAGALSTLGIDNPDSKRQYEDNLEITKRKQNNSRTTFPARSYIAKQMGANAIHKDLRNMTKARYIKTLSPVLEAGYGVVTSFGSHIVRIVGITDEGLVVNDPYGELKNFSKRWNNRKDAYLNADKNSKTSSNSENGGQKGALNLWPWSTLVKYPLAYYEYYKLKE